GPGELALYHARTRTLGFGDLVINLPSHAFSILPDKYCQNPRQARTSLQKLRDLPIEQITFAHGLPVVMGAGDRLRSLLDAAN
ncbi:MAG: hypothetical protein JO069_00875, partial [Verrucomicrobia bacterium]|nr:hypothetical protein [Verrucomicrobiota bacterium]